MVRKAKSASRTPPQQTKPHPRARLARREDKRPAGARPVWSGNLRLALVAIAINVFAATRSGVRISFHQIHQPSGKRIRHHKVEPGVGPVNTGDIVKGFEVGGDQYVLIDPEDIGSVRLEAKKTIDLVEFVEQGEVDRIWFDQSSYVVPDGEPAEEAYIVLREALRTSCKMGLGQLIMRGREYVVAIKPCGRGLALETFRFADEVGKSTPFFSETDDIKLDPELLGLARELIDRKTPPFDPGRLHDHHSEAVRALIDAKVKHHKPVHVEEKALAGSAKVVNPVEAIKRSVWAAEYGPASARWRAG